MQESPQGEEDYVESERVKQQERVRRERERPRAARSEDSRKADSRDLKEEVQKAVKREPKVEMARARADRVGPAVRHNIIHTIAHKIHKHTEVKPTHWQTIGQKVKGIN